MTRSVTRALNTIAKRFWPKHSINQPHETAPHRRLGAGFGTIRDVPETTNFSSSGSAGPASEVSGGSDGRDSSRRRCHNAGWSPARPEHAAQRRQRCCIAAISRPEHPSPMWAPCRKKMLKDVRVACHAHNPTAPPHPHRPCSHRRRFACVRRCVEQLGS